MTDQLDDLFTALRADTAARVRPPGAAAARRTVRRRRTGRALGAAAGLVVVGMLGTTLLGPLGPPRLIGTAADRSVRAAALLAPEPGRTYLRSGHGVVAGSSTPTTLTVAGTYRIRLVCVGRGKVTLTLSTIRGGAVARSVAADCGTDGPVPRDAAISVGQPVTVRLTGDDAARGAGYAYTVQLSESDRIRLAAEATAALPAAAGTVLSTLSKPGGHVRSVTKGSYVVHFACAGAGSVGLVLQTFRYNEWLEIPCRRPVRADGLPFELQVSGRLSILLTPELDTDRQSGYVVRLDRLS